jgi:hypothetical protein
VDGSAISSTEVVVQPLPALWNELARIHAEFGARVDQELPFAVSVSNEEAASRCEADVLPVMSAALVSLLVVSAGWCTLLRCGSKTAVVPTEGGLSSREGDLLFWRRFLGVGRGSLVLVRGSQELE